MINPDEMNSPETCGHAQEYPNRAPHPRPTVGRIVHYHAGEPDPQAPAPMAAIVTGYTPDGRVCLTVFAINGSFITEAPAGGPDADTPTQGCWTWPPRV